MIKKLFALALAAVLALVGFDASPAQAARTGSISFYASVGVSDLLASYAAANLTPSVCYQMSTSITNRTRYITNSANVSFVVFDSRFCDSAPGPIYAHSAGSMAGSQWDLSISSFYMNP